MKIKLSHLYNLIGHCQKNCTIFTISQIKRYTSKNITRSSFPTLKLSMSTVAKTEQDTQKVYKQILGDHTGLQQNHIWTESELQEKLSVLYHHKPHTYADHFMHKLMYGLYHGFNFVTGYKQVNPSVASIEWRLIVLESIAGVPGFVAAGFRHFGSLRTLQRDNGWIATLLEEAENERMHLLLCLSKFEAGTITRTMVITAQMVMVPVLMTVYAIHPRSMHRFVGYLEETACKTYVNIIDHVETPGTHLHIAWHDSDASNMAKGYYKLPENAKFVYCLKCMCADESHHRDVNHTFADMDSRASNPFITTHREDSLRAWTLSNTGETAWDKNISPAAGAAHISKPTYKDHFTFTHAKKEDVLVRKMSF
jgi:hypothetical protein